MPFEPMRHMLASIAFRFHAVVVDAPESFGDFDPGHGIRSPRALVRHCVQVLRLARSSFEPGLELSAGGRENATWDDLVGEVHDELRQLDQHLQAESPTHEWPLENLVHGPFSDVLTHVGQLAILRRLQGHPVERQSYLRAQVETGRVGIDQPPPAPRRP